MKKYYFVSEGTVGKVSHVVIQCDLVVVVLDTGEELLLSTAAYNTLKGLKKGDEIVYHQSSSIHKCTSKDMEINVLGNRENLEVLKARLADGEFV
ncbi:MAG: hypothetical protein E7019_03885 [Alphaproteobacteria bacterium]|nr:hypothetical protein [Alphaproteobacteria bacterium]